LDEGGHRVKASEISGIEDMSEGLDPGSERYGAKCMVVPTMNNQD